jgi:hypothetical protein
VAIDIRASRLQLGSNSDYKKAKTRVYLLTVSYHFFHLRQVL